MRPPRSILIVATRQIGDVLLATPLLHSVRVAWPHAHIVVLVNRDKGGMLEGNRDCDEVIEVSEHPKFAEYRTLLPRLFRKYDLAINTLAGDRPHLYALWAARTRASIVVDEGWKGRWKWWASQYRVELDNLNTHTVLQNLELARVIGIERLYTVTPPAADSAVRAYEEGLGLDWRRSGFAVLHPAPMWRYKRWTEDGWMALVSYLLSRFNHVVLTGGPGREEKTFLGRLVRISPSRVHSLGGVTRFAESVELLKHAALYVGPDTAMTHLAASCNTPTVAIYGPSNPVKWGPWPARHVGSNPWKMLDQSCQQVNNVVLLQGVQPPDRENCVPCREEGCERHKESESDCLKQLSVNDVVRAVEVLVGQRTSL